MSLGLIFEPASQNKLYIFIYSYIYIKQYLLLKITSRNFFKYPAILYIY